MHRFTLKIAGESGQGISSLGEIVVKALKNTGFHVFAYREYPSLIKGGFSCYQIDIANKSINSSSKYTDLMVCISRRALHNYLPLMNDKGVVIHSLNRVIFSQDETNMLKGKQIQIKHIDAFKYAKDIGGSPIFENIIMAGVLWKLMELDLSSLEEEITVKFGKRPDLLELDLKCLRFAYGLSSDLPALKLELDRDLNNKDNVLLTGNAALTFGAIAAGVRAYYSYPMTPASSILTHFAEWAGKTGVLVKQAEDEITAAQMALGSMFMGTRALVATSGGGFDLMTETISSAGMTETPMVCIIGQRPGPATGLPTWTAAGDLNLAIYAGHGEFPRAVLAASDIESCYTLIQDAFNIAEVYQIPVMVLTEKQIAESIYSVNKLPEDLPIIRGLVEAKDFAELKSTDRFAYVDGGVSKRWLPGSKAPTYDANSDEHDEEGNVIEDAMNANKMMEKRMAKMNLLLDSFPEPKLVGNPDAKTILVGWGSVKGTVLDALERLQREDIAYLHYEHIFPLKTKLISKLFSEERKLVAIENNYLGQLADLIRQNSNVEFADKLLKYDGRPFFIEDIINYFAK